MKRKTTTLLLIATLTLVGTVLLPVSMPDATTTAVSDEPVILQQNDPQVTYEFYDFFQAKMDPDVWGRPEEEGGEKYVGRYYWYGTDYVVSWDYPVVYARVSPSGSTAETATDASYFTSGRLNVNARDLPLNIDTNAWNDTYGGQFGNTALGAGHRSFVPYNLTGGLGSADATTQGGYCNINWYMQFTDRERTNYWGWGPERSSPSYPNGFCEGWLVELNGTIQLDKLGCMKVLGMNATTYDNLDTEAATWCVANYVNTTWVNWLDSAGNWWPMTTPMTLGWFYAETLVLGNEIWAKQQFAPYTTPPDWPWNLPGVSGIFDLSDWPNTVTIPIWFFSWHMEYLMARWLFDYWSEWGGFIPYEYYYSDFHINASIGPTSSDIDIDTQVDWLLTNADGVGETGSPARWLFESFYGDYPSMTRATQNGLGVDFPWSPGWPYKYYGDPAKTYDWSPWGSNYSDPVGNGTRKRLSSTAPGAASYGSQVPYGYTPGVFDLGLDRSYGAGGIMNTYPQAPDPHFGNHTGWNETLIIDWSHIQDKGKIWGYKQEPWTTYPNDAITKVFGELVMNITLSQPNVTQFPTSGPGSINYNPALRTITFRGPLNMSGWSQTNNAANWTALADPQYAPNGLLPWGIPLIYWEIQNVTTIHNVAIASTNTSRPVWHTNTWTEYDDYQYGLYYTYNDTTVDIYATAKNRGTVTETFNVSTYVETAGVWNLIGTQTVTDLQPCHETTLHYTWTTPSVAGTHKIKANVTLLTAIDTYSADNEFILTWSNFTAANYPDPWIGPDWSCMSTHGGAIEVIVRAPPDVAVTGITPSLPQSYLDTAYPTWQTAPPSLEIDVTVYNNGSFTETFTVTLYLEGSTKIIIETETVTNLAAKTSKVITVACPIPADTWPYTTYTIKAKAYIVADANHANDELSNGTITVKCSGDANGNGHVNLSDLSLLADHWFGHLIPARGYDPRVDFNMDGKIDLGDLSKLADNWFKGPLDP